MRLIKKLGFCLVTAIPAVALAACSSGAGGAPSGAPPEVSSIAIDVIPTADAVGIYIAADNGYFAKQGLNVKIVTDATSNDAIGDLQNGSVQLIEGFYPTVIQAQMAGSYDGKPADMRFVANTSQMTPGNQGLYVMPGRYTSVQQLVDAHAKVGVSLVNNTASLLLGSLLEVSGDKASDLKEVAENPAYLPALLANGTVAAAYLPEPLGTWAAQSVGAVRLADFDQGSVQNLPIGMIAGSTSWVKSHPNTVAAFQRGLAEGQQVADDGDRHAVERALVKYTPGLSSLILANVTLDLYPLAMNVPQMQRVPDAMYKYGLISKPFQVSSMIEPGKG